MERNDVKARKILQPLEALQSTRNVLDPWKCIKPFGKVHKERTTRNIFV